MVYKEQAKYERLKKNVPYVPNRAALFNVLAKLLAVYASCTYALSSTHHGRQFFIIFVFDSFMRWPHILTLWFWILIRGWALPVSWSPSSCASSLSPHSVSHNGCCRDSQGISLKITLEINELDNNVCKLTKKFDDCYELQRWEAFTSACWTSIFSAFWI